MTQAFQKMTKKTNLDDIVNITLDGRHRDAIYNNDNVQNPVDKIRAMLDKIKSTHQSLRSDKEELFGYNLFSRRVTMNEFVMMYPEDSAFFKELLNHKNVNKANAAAHFVECRIHIPEITGLFPLPDWSILREQNKLYDDYENVSAENNQKKMKEIDKKIEDTNKKLFKEILKINLYPRMYYYTAIGESIDKGGFCKVKFTKSMPTMATGLVLEILDDGVIIT